MPWMMSDATNSTRGEDPRVVVLEGTDARHLDASIIKGRVGAVVADVSYISLTKALLAALRLAAPGAWLVVPGEAAIRG